MLAALAKEAPKDEISANARLLARAGFTDKLMAGVYTYLPLGLRVLKKIENIIRDEMNKAADSIRGHWEGEAPAEPLFRSSLPSPSLVT